jgi:hypothetical protein
MQAGRTIFYLLFIKRICKEKMNTPEKSKYFIVTTAGTTLHKSRESTRGQIWPAAH